jgi:hypothetical protein
MFITLQGLNLLVTGAIGKMDRVSVESAIRRGGGTIAPSPTKKVDYIAIGEKPGEKTVEKARSLGLPELSAEQLIQLLHDGQLDVTPAPAMPSVALGEAVGELRGLLDGPPSAEVWAALCDLIDRAEPERAADLIAYALPHVARWRLDMPRRWWCSMTAWHAPEANQWLCGDLRRAPLTWMHELLQGQHDPKHALIHAISLEHTKANASMGAALLDSPHLHNVRALDTGNDLKLARSFFKKLAQTPNLPNLDTLAYYPLKLGGGEELAAGAFPALRHLHLRAIIYSTDNASSTADMDAIFQAPWIGQIETIEACMGRSTGWTRMSSPYPQIKQHSARLKNLKRLILHDTTYLDDLLSAPVLDQIQELVVAVESEDTLVVMLNQLDKHAWPSLTRLDLSQQLWPNGLPKKTRFRPLNPTLQGVIVRSKLAQRIPTIVLGPHATDAMRTKLASDARTII